MIDNIWYQRRIIFKPIQNVGNVWVIISACATLFTSMLKMFCFCKTSIYKDKMIEKVYYNISRLNSKILDLVRMNFEDFMSFHPPHTVQHDYNHGDHDRDSRVELSLCQPNVPW